MKKENHVLSGSMTIEAAYICTAVVLILFFLLYAGFFCHDRAAAANEAVYLARFAAENSLKWLDIDRKIVDREEELGHTLTDSWNLTWQSRRQQIIDRGYEQIRQKMLFCKIKNVSADCSYNYLLNRIRCTVTVEGVLSFPLNFWGRNGLEFEETGSADEIDAVSAIWMREGIEQAGHALIPGE